MIKVPATVRTVQFDPGEEEKFWPLYDVYAKEMGPVLQQLTELLARYQYNADTLSDQEANKIIDGLLAANTRSIEVQQTHLSKVRKVLPAQRVLQVSYILLVPSL